VQLQDPETGSHARRVTRLVIGTLAVMGSRSPEWKPIVWAASLHDIGKLGIPQSILCKPGLLTREERRLIEQHATLGAELLSRFSALDQVVEIVRHHHECWDGTGYPHRLAGAQIPFGARVIAVADSFDAMTSDRPYRPAMTAERALAILEVGRWQQWDGAVVDAFVRALQEQPVAVRALRQMLPAAHTCAAIQGAVRPPVRRSPEVVGTQSRGEARAASRRIAARDSTRCSRHCVRA